MKNALLFIVCLLCSNLGLAQEEELPEALIADSTWFKEIIKFPIGFAQEIKYEGFEDLRFAPGFTKADSPELWCYVWAWSLNNIKSLTIKQLERDVTYYFDGLFGLDPIENKTGDLTTNAEFIKKVTTDGSLKYIGRVNTFDTRYTKKPLSLNVQIDSNYCEKENKSIIVFKFSPQDFNHEIWNTFGEVRLRDDVCN